MREFYYEHFRATGEPSDPVEQRRHAKYEHRLFGTPGSDDLFGRESDREVAYMVWYLRWWFGLSYNDAVAAVVDGLQSSRRRVTAKYSAYKCSAWVFNADRHANPLTFRESGGSSADA